MPATKFTVTHADGTVSTRKSQNGSYTHAVIVATTREHRARQLDVRAESNEAAAAKATAAATGAITETDKSWAGGKSRYHSVYVGGAFVTSYVTSDVPGEYVTARPTDDELRAILTDSAARCVEFAAGLRAQAASVRAGVDVVYGAARWSSRRDLAAKYADQLAGYGNGDGWSVEVVPVD